MWIYFLGMAYMTILVYGYGSIPINTIFRGMNIHLPAILMFTRGTRFWHTAICLQRQRYCETLILLIAVFVILLALIDLVALWRCHEEVLGISPMLGDQTCWACHMQGKWSCTAKRVQRNLHAIHSLEFGVWRQWMKWPIPAYSWWAKGGFVMWISTESKRVKHFQLQLVPKSYGLFQCQVGHQGCLFSNGLHPDSGTMTLRVQRRALTGKKHISGRCWSKCLELPHPVFIITLSDILFSLVRKLQTTL